MVSNATRLPEWLEEFEQVVQQSEGPVGQGTLFRYTLGPGPGERSGILQWVEWDPPRRLAWDGPPLMSRLGGARPRGSFEVVELGSDRCRFVSRYQPELSGGLVLARPMLVRWLKRQRRADTRRLKHLLERHSATPQTDL
jgi:Polyketide cyclase / dehydrase and lipid transport